MILNNLTKILNTYMMKMAHSNSATLLDMTAIDGTAAEYYQESVGGLYSIANSFNIYLGDSDTAPTPSDYSLGNQLLVLSANRTFQKFNDIRGCVYTATGTNTTENTVTIKEVGLAVMCSANSSSQAGYHNYILIAKKVLDTPITLEPGDPIAISYAIDLSTMSDGVTA